MCAAGAIHHQLMDARWELLDLTTRNRLINTRRRTTRSGRLEIVHERSEDVFRLLVEEKKSMAFRAAEPAQQVSPANVDQPNGPSILQPEESDTDPNRSSPDLADRLLQSDVPTERLQRKLLNLFYDARTFEQEQGINILFLALGFLKWYEDDKSDVPRHAPLILVPVELQRSSVHARFRIAYTDAEISTNISLQEKLRIDFGIRIPDIADDEDLSPEAYFAEVAQSVAGHDRWEVLSDDIVLWFFSFAKFLMYRDLSPEVWPEDRSIETHRVVSSLLGDGFDNAPPICSEEQSIDEFLHPAEMIHVMDADSSQALVIEEVKQGRNLVVQGPPGTGKSQTIANVIASAVKEGLKILFVAEKMAALEVVKRRLSNIGLGDICLELHSHMANKRAVLQELAGTLQLGRPQVADIETQANSLKVCRDKLNRHAEIMHAYLEPAHVTPFQALGALVRLRRGGLFSTDLQLHEPLAWSPEDVARKQALLTDVVRHIEQLGSPRDHAWRGVRRGTILPTDSHRFMAELREVSAKLQRLVALASSLAEVLRQTSPATANDISLLLTLGDRLLAAPAIDAAAMKDEAWEARGAAINELVQAGCTLAQCRAELNDRVTDAAWRTSVKETRRVLADRSSSWFRWLYGDYRKAVAVLERICNDKPPRAAARRLSLLDRLEQGQQALRIVEDELHDLGERAFGSLWKAADSDWSLLQDIVQWDASCRDAGCPANFRSVLASLDGKEHLRGCAEEIARQLPLSLERVQSVFDELQLDRETALGSQDARHLPLADIRQRIAAWAADPEGLATWIAYRTRRDRLAAEGMGRVAAGLEDGTLDATAGPRHFESAYYESLMREAFRLHPQLACFDGISHEQVLQQFRSLDVQRLELARQEVALAHFEGLPDSGGRIGELGLLRREMKKKRRHLPLRRLLAEAGHAVQSIKPVFMMSPVSIAQYLEPGVLDFDLLLIDEASQVKPVDALGAIARCRQMVVVGDEKQLPPTRFFSRLVDADDVFEDDAHEFQAGDMESILGLCEAQSVPARMLRWHYRSRHHSLIAVSNRQFYDNKLYVIPSPVRDSESLGLRFHHVRGGQFDRGRSATNRIEAASVAEAVMEHARTRPEKTLGVGAFSVSQRDAILDELELRRREAPELEGFFADGQPEPFFVKNLENIQGDERDVIFISVGYARDRSGSLSMNFGPLNNEGGHRRLNVLITRARERCEVFSSITADDIDLTRSGAFGVQALKSYLAYAQSGREQIAIPSGRDHDSEFERQVADAIQSLGYEVHAQVGEAGFFVDLAVCDPDAPGRYVIGVECDGASYHSARWARDRDRLRQQVLEDRGWRMHRIWSTDWFYRPEEQLRKVSAAIEEARIVPGETQPPAPEADPEECQAPQPRAIARVPLETAAGRGDGGTDSVPYREADFPVDASCELHEMPDAELMKLVVRIIEIEGPVHRNEIARRAASLWQLQRAGKRVVRLVNNALVQASKSGRVVPVGPFYTLAGQTDIPVRSRAEVASSYLRKPRYLPPQEICQALRVLVESHLGVEPEEAVVETARLFGFRSTSSQLREAIQQQLKYLMESGEMDMRNGKMYPVEQAKAAPPDSP